MFKTVAFVFMAAALTLSAADSSTGTWKANMAKSKYSPGPAPKSSTNIQTQDGDWTNFKGEGVNAEGQATSTTIRFKHDGKEYPFTTIKGAKGTIAAKRIDARTTESTIRMGTATTNIRTVVAADGKTFTRTTTGTNAKGEKMKNVVVFEKQ